MASKVGAANTGEAFIGGAQTRNLGPPNVIGTGIPSANTRVGAPVGGVNPSPMKQARPNQGSNIGIPYTRLVPLHNRNALFAPKHKTYDANNNLVYDPNQTKGEVVKKLVTETEDLRPYTLAFILGLRSSTQPVGNATNKRPGYGVPGMVLGTEDDEAPTAYDGHNVGFQPVIMPGMVGTERFQQLCSLQYLEAYFWNVLRGKTISLNTNLLTVYDSQLVNSDKSTGAVGTVLAAQKYMNLLRGNVGEKPENVLNGKTLLDVGDLASGMGMTGSDAAAGAADPVMGGIFARDFGPFLRGKGGKSELVNCTVKNLPQQVGEGPNAMQVAPYSVSRNLGDDLAFSLLESLLAKNGVSDWRPDGLVLSKGVNDPSDKLSDEMLEARDGQLYNIRVQGPAIGTTWTGEKSMETLPMDKCYIVIVADVWFNREWDEMRTANQLKAYNVARAAALGKGFNIGNFKKNQYDAFEGKGDDKTTLCNFRVMASTSSQMVNYSKFVPPVLPGTKDTRGPTTKLSAASRMGLQLCDDFGEYVVGAWQIGNVMDTSASRAAMPQGSNIGVRTAPNSSALNVNVNIGYWSPDRLYRSFSNVDGGITPRYKKTRPREKDAAVDAQASKRRFGALADAEKKIPGIAAIQQVAAAVLGQ